MDKNKKEHATELNDEMLNGVAGGSVEGSPIRAEAICFCQDCNRMVPLNNPFSNTKRCGKCLGMNVTPLKLDVL